MLNPLSEKLKYNSIILASQSPRRKMLLQGLGIPFDVKIKEIEETFPPEFNTNEIASYLSIKKSDAYLNEIRANEIIITADTIVLLNNKVLNKPTNSEEAFRMLKELSGKMHEVFTGVTIQSLNKKNTFSVCTKVWFKLLNNEEINFYIQEFKPFDKAGAYGAQEWIGYIGIEKLEGSYFNVMGLPTKELFEALIKF